MAYKTSLANCVTLETQRSRSVTLVFVCDEVSLEYEACPTGPRSDHGMWRLLQGLDKALNE
jgi:hypothetical protein